MASPAHIWQRDICLLMDFDDSKVNADKRYLARTNFNPRVRSARTSHNRCDCMNVLNGEIGRAHV